MKRWPLVFSLALAACSSDPSDDAGADAGPSDSGAGSGLAVRAGGPDDETAKDVAARGTGWVVVGGFEGVAQFGATTLTSAGDEDAFVAAYAADGTLAWAIAYGTPGRDDARAVDVLPDGAVLVTGVFEGQLALGGTTLTASASVDGYLLKLSPTGQLTWAKRFGGAGFDDPRGLDAADDGKVVVSGAFGGRMVLGPGEPGQVVLTNGGTTENGFVALFGPDGQARWGAVAGGPAAVRLQDVVFLADGAVLVGGSYLNTVTFGPGPNATTLTTGLTDNGILGRYTADGQFTRAFQLGGDGSEFIERLLARGDGGYDVVGTFSSASFSLPGGATLSASARTDFFAARFGADDREVWARSIGGGDFDSATGLAPGPSGGLLVSGHVRGGGEVTFAPGAPGSLTRPSPGRGDALYASFSSQGELLAGELLGGPGYDTTAGVVPGPVLVGQFSESFTPKGGALTSAGGLDLFFISP